MIERKKIDSGDEDFFVRVQIKIGDKVIEQDLEQTLAIPNNLTPASAAKIMAENPVVHARWNVLYNEAVYEYDAFKTRLDVWLSRKSQDYRKELEQVTKGRVTDKMIDEMLKLDPEYESMNNQLSAFKKNMKHIYAIAMGLGERGDKVLSLASLMKWEAENLGGRQGFEKKKYNYIKRPEDKEVIADPNVNDGWPVSS